MSLGAFLAGLALWAAQDDLNSDDAALRREAYQRLEALAGEERAKGVDGFSKLQEKRHREFEREWKRLHDTFLDCGQRGEQGTMEVLKEWLAARDSAVEIIFDEKRYPVPPGARASGPMQGWDLVRPRLDAAKKAFEPILPQAKEGASAALRGSWTRGLEKLKQLAALVREGDEALRRLRPEWRPLAIESFDFLEAMAHIGRQEFKEAIGLYEKGKLSPAQRILFFLVYAAIIENYNHNKIRTRMNGSDKQAVTAINEYRMALGVLPYEHDPLLTDAIKGHIADIASGRTEYGHLSTVSGKRTPQDRARLAGWKWGAGENLASMGAMESVEAWFWDGGHGRNNVSPHDDKVGFATGGGVSGLSNGGGGPLVLPRFKPPFSYGGWSR